MISHNLDQILFTTKGSSSLFFIGDEDSPAAFLSFRHKDEKVIVAEHTVVSESLRGKGIAARLAKKLMTYARENELKIIPVCSYISGFFDKNHSFADLRATNH